MKTDNFSILYFVTVLIRGTIIKFRGHRGFNPESSSPESPVCTTAVHSHKMPREMVVFKSVWTQRHKKDQRSEISTTGLRSRRSEAPRAFAGSELSECHFLVYFVTVLIRGTIIKFRGHRGFNPESSSPESPVCTTAVHSHKMPREMVVFKSVWTQRHKKDQRSEISTTGLRSRRSEAPRAFAGSELSECHFLVYFVTVLIRGTIIKFRGHRGFNPESSSPESPVCTTAVHSHKMPREMVVYKSVWTQRHKKDQRSEISTTGLRSRRSEAPRAFAGSELSECHFLVVFFMEVNPGWQPFHGSFKPWNACLGTWWPIETFPWSWQDHCKAAMFFLHHGKPTIVSTAGFRLVNFQA